MKQPWYCPFCRLEWIDSSPVCDSCGGLGRYGPAPERKPEASR